MLEGPGATSTLRDELILHHVLQHRKLPRPALAMFWGQSALPTGFLVPKVPGCSASRNCHQPFWADGAGRHSVRQGCGAVTLWVWTNGVLGLVKLFL